MENSSLASGDNSILLPTLEQRIDKDVDDQFLDQKNVAASNEKDINFINAKSTNGINTELIEKNEAKMKERIAQIKTLIVSLKSELKDEKSNLEEARKFSKCSPQSTGTLGSVREDMKSTENVNDLYPTAAYSACIDNKLSCDENLMEYEKQLQIYQDTLNMAQLEKKNAIRKQMLAKAYKLKLLEVENQCNIELLRVKQSLQCLEPLQMIAKNWKFNDEDYNLNNYDLIPRFPELKETNPSVIVDNSKDDSEDKLTQN